MLNITEGLNKEFVQGKRAEEFFEMIKSLNNFGGIKNHDYTRLGWSAKQQELKDYLENCNNFGYPYEAWSKYRKIDIYPSLRDFIDATYKIVVEQVRKYAKDENLQELTGLEDSEVDNVIRKVTLSRISRAYISFLQEDYAIYKMLDMIPNIKIYSSSILDKHFGIDFVVVGLDEDDELQTFNIHVLKNSDTSRMHYDRKSNMTNYPLNVATKSGETERVHIKRNFKSDLEYYYPAHFKVSGSVPTLSIGDFHVPADYIDKATGLAQNIISDVVVMELLVSANKHERYEESTLKKVKDLVKDLDLDVTIEKQTNI